MIVRYHHKGRTIHERGWCSYVFGWLECYHVGYMPPEYKSATKVVYPGKRWG